MSFSSVQFLIFFPIVVILYFLIPYKLRWIWLLIASYYFYISYNPKYVALIFTTTIITYIIGLLMEKANLIKDKKRSIKVKKFLVFLSVSSNIGILALFKYYNFFSTSLIHFFSKFNISVHMPTFDFLLPVGISFYTFQALSYTIDVYRQDVKVEKNLGRYALFVSFFPQLLSGPIQKSKNFIHQIDERHYFDYNRVKNGVILMMWGYFQKTMVADRIGQLVNTVYSSPGNYKGFEIVIATVFFGFQLYCDFSAYSNIAIGAAQVMGFSLSKNFERPYFSKSIREFWRRWHMSLTSWFMDYLYFPLGGSRCSKLRKHFNVMVVFVISGLWHGAGFTFLIWGLLHGTYYIIEDMLKPVKNKFIKRFNIKTNIFIYKLIQVIITFGLVDFAWLFFRANSFKSSLVLIKNMVYFNPEIFINGSLYKLGLDHLNFLVAILSLVIVLIVDLFQRREGISDKLLTKNIVFRWSLYLASVLIILIFGAYGSDYNVEQFIYSQF
ncbi:MAG: MBOAT family protein [Clostridium tyrobutyricum]|uniref:MBOAT family O-acyltransferase n=1 Tax=Clostridium tyrobutyricum TaxID=1519 RepID=UPI0011CA5D34|nr:MBOAT family O-acyltransferase [Clostridium tyrobutyricum]MBV4423567.1 MBOAT family protein [Clostridium tyrobutyricum]MBV4441239.1 MBOAT family protein [Clostridium tyrobutyricum]MCH4199723.1 MBOAT family protein [Clostridium tyrobutyricum]MCH4259869.1 MBOAT family protein [Clostridium tyrobutyricum]MCI1653583.1 MBOAT family protein [Clostridium tyrobutyricum]